MRLSELKTGERGVIVKVNGHGGFRKRIIEMGFVRGNKVKVILNAPLRDPIEYEIIGYKISLRREQAEKIEVISESEARELLSAREALPALEADEEVWMEKLFEERRRVIKVALVGNPNCGKTSLFNIASGSHEHVGNYSGVTVDAKEGTFEWGGYHFKLIDRPGTYSLSAYSPEELYVRKNLIEDVPDVIINVVDASNLQRNLYLTTQLIDMHLRVVMALNMYDELQAKGDKLDIQQLGWLLGMPIVPTVSRTGDGIEALFDTVIQIYEKSDPHLARHIHINHGAEIEQSINRIKDLISRTEDIRYKYSTRYLAIKYLENDKEIEKVVESLPDRDEIISARFEENARIRGLMGSGLEASLVDAKYAFIHGALEETYTHAPQNNTAKKYRLDNILTHKWFGLPLFFLFMYLTFQLTFFIGQYPTDWIDAAVAWLGSAIGNMLPDGVLKDLVVDGAIAGVGSVIVFFPQIMILFLFLSFMEDTGYMARVAFLMDKIMHKIGLHGKSVIPIIMGFGCNVPAIMATRTLENRRDRIITIMMIPFMSCGTKYPIYMLFVTALFTKYQGAILFSVYFIGMLMAVFTALMIKKFFKRKDDVPFVMELPPYRMPTVRNSLSHMWGRSQQYLRKMGTTILAGSIFIWALGYFPHKTEFSVDYDKLISKVENSIAPEQAKISEIQQLEAQKKYEQIEQSYIAQIGQFVEPVFRPLDYDWKIGVSLFTGIAAKELILSSMGVLYQSPDDSEITLQNKLAEQTYDSGDKIGQQIFTPSTGYSLMLFILIYLPCIAAIAAIVKEAGAKWALFMTLYSCTMAWLAAFLVKLFT